MAAFNTVAVIGAGAWGTALAGVAARAGRGVTLYARDASHAGRIAWTRENPRLPGIKLGSEITVTHDIAKASHADIILVATPAQHLRAAVNVVAPHLREATPVIACAKGIEHGTHKFMTEVIAESALHARPAILSGPSFADDVARGLPTAVTLAAKDEALAADLVRALGSATFRPYHTTDVRGVEIGGAAKNVLAIAAGIVVGKQLGASALAALTTRGFSELARLGRALGARGGNHGRAVGPWRSDPDLLAARLVAQFRARDRARTRRAAAGGEASRRRIHRAGADRTRRFATDRTAGINGGRGDPFRETQHRRRDRGLVDASLQGRGMSMSCRGRQAALRGACSS